MRQPEASAVAEGDADLGGASSTHRYEWDATYRTADYIDLLLTYSGTRSLPTTRRDRLLECIAQLIDRRYGGVVVKRYLTQLRLTATPV